MALEFKMPKLGESVTEGTIGRWLKQPGDKLELYEPMLEVTTDKVDTEVSSPIDGTLVEILVAEGETVAVGTVIARLADPGEASNGHSAAESGANTAPAQAAQAAAGQSKGGHISPAVARLAAEHNIDPRAISGTGAGGRVTKKDIEAYVASGGARAKQPEQPATASARATVAAAESATAPSPQMQAQVQQGFEVGPRTPDEERALEPAVSHSPAPTAQPTAQPAVQPTAQPPVQPALGPDDELVPLTTMRRVIAEHMVRSKRTAPHVTTVMEADLSRIMAHRARTKADFERQGVKLTFMPYFIQATVAGLREVPIVNATFSDEGILMHQRINIGMAVAIPDGLIVPVLKDADDKSLLGLARAVNDLAERARTRRLQADETQGGTFTITNHGVSGSIFAMPIINQPQAAILGVGAMQKRAVVITENGMDAIAIRPMCYLSLTFDHRLIDGATADGFLGVIKRTLESYSG
jgi:2-oxoglutarate dehydrogenase E2 component (dihydrolipoamide succinyltransferase)